MNKIFSTSKAKVVLTVCAIVTAVSALAELGVGVFQETRAIQVLAPNNPTVATQTFTNKPVDLYQFQGRGEFIVNVLTNGTGGGGIAATCQAYLYSSPDTTNWTLVPNYAVISSATTVITTNYYYGFGTNGLGGVLSTNAALLPYSLLTPTPSVNLFNTPYQAWDLFTNNGPVNLSMGSLTAGTSGTASTGGTTIIGVNVQDNGRYFELVYTNSGIVTNGSSVFSTVFVGTPKNYLQP